VSSYVAVVRHADHYLWRRRPDGAPNAGLWELPSTEWHAGAPETEAARDALEDLGRELGRRWRVGEPLTRIRHGITHHRIDFVAHGVEDPGRRRDADGLRWATPEEASDMGLTAATAKILRKLPPLL
jgi:adenine-specific DNA glycosylase